MQLFLSNSKQLFLNFYFCFYFKNGEKQIKYFRAA